MTNNKQNMTQMELKIKLQSDRIVNLLLICFGSVVDNYYNGDIDRLHSDFLSFHGITIKRNNHNMRDYIKKFNIPLKLITDNWIMVDGKKKRLPATDILRNLRIFRLVGKSNRKFKSGKKYNHLSYWMITDWESFVTWYNNDRNSNMGNDGNWYNSNMKRIQEYIADKKLTR